MDSLTNLAAGFAAALTPEALLYCLIGVTIGTFIGVLPGIGALTTIALCLPLTFHLDPLHGLIMLTGIFYGAQYGSSTASILLNVPGSAPSAITCLDGHPMAQQGRAGAALFLCTAASFVGGTISLILLVFFAPALAKVAIGFSAADYFSIMLLALIAGSTLSVGSPLKGLSMVALGLCLGLVGTDVSSGTMRFNFGVPALADGISLVALAMGLFGVAEILVNLARGEPARLDAKQVTLRSLMPSRDDMKRFRFSSLRGGTIGSLVGLLPGTGPTIATFIAYATEKRIAKDPSRFGKGAAEGVISPEAANNASVQAAFIPTMALGVPGDAVMAVLMAGLLIHGITPGPQLMVEQGHLFWGVVASFWIGNLMLLVLNLPMIGVWVRILSIPYRLLYPSILFLICIGVYTVNNSTFDVLLTGIFGVLGFFMSRWGFPAAPLLLGFVLGPLLEENFRRALSLADGDLSTFATRPISAVFLVASVGLLAYAAIGARAQAAKSDRSVKQS